MAAILLLAACANPPDDSVSRAAAYLPAALSLPMPTLYNKAMSGNARDWLDFGLALSAGRPSPVMISEADSATLAQLDARLQAAKRDWLKENPAGSEEAVPWANQINLSGPEAAVILRVEQANSADYWLSRAEEATVSKPETYVVATRYGANIGGVAPGAAVPVVDRNVLLTATACASTLRGALGLVSRSLPEVIWRMPYRPTRGIVAEANHTGGKGWVVGPAACGKPEIFKRYVGLLRVSTLGMRGGIS